MLKNYVNSIQRQASENFSNFNGGAMTKLGSFNRTLTFQITLTTTSAVGKAILFGYGYNPSDSLQTNCTVVVKESSHFETKIETVTSPFRIQGIRYQVTNAAQLANPFSVIRKKATGGTTTELWQPNSYTNPENNQDKLIIDPTFQMVVTASDRIEIDLNAGETLTVIFYIVDQIKSEQILSGMSGISTTSEGIPTGKTATPTVLLDASAFDASRRGLNNFSLKDEMNNASGDIFANGRPY